MDVGLSSWILPSCRGDKQLAGNYQSAECCSMDALCLREEKSCVLVAIPLFQPEDCNDRSRRQKILVQVTFPPLIVDCSVTPLLQPSYPSPSPLPITDTLIVGTNLIIAPLQHCCDTKPFFTHSKIVVRLWKGGMWEKQATAETRCISIV